MKKPYKGRRYSAGLFVRLINNEPHVLAVISSKHPNKFQLPAGNSRGKESPRDTLVREFQEETGGLIPTDFLEVRKEFPHNNYTKHFFLVSQVRVSKNVLGNPMGVSYIYKCTERDGEQLTARWVPIETMREALFRKHRKGFEDALDFCLSKEAEAA